MNMIYVPDKETVTARFGTSEMFILAITYDEETAAIAPIDEAPEHYILPIKPVSAKSTSTGASASYSTTRPPSGRSSAPPITRISPTSKSGSRSSTKTDSARSRTYFLIWAI